MRIIKPAEGADATLRKLAAAMLNLEHGAEVYDADLARRPEPWAPCPLVPLPAITRHGQASALHYKAAVGCVFVASGGALTLAALAARLAPLLDAADASHLAAPRAVLATPAAVVRQACHSHAGTRLVGPRRPYRGPPKRPPPTVPARLLLFAGAAECALPPPVSHRAIFTWALLPAAAALAICGELGPAEVNALVASLWYEGGRCTRFADGADVYDAAELNENWAHQRDAWWLPSPPAISAPARLPEPPTAPAPAAEPALAGWQRLVAVGGAARGALLVRWADAGRPRGRLEYVGDHRTLRRPCTRLAPDRLHTRPGAALRLEAGRARQCVACAAPLAGTAVVLVGASRERLAAVREAGAEHFRAQTRAGTPLEPQPLLCLHCYGAAPSLCLMVHLRARPWLTALEPATQADACAACPGYEALALLLRSPVTALPERPGAFRLETPEGALIIAAKASGPTSANGVPVLRGLRLAEALGPE